ncbi:HAMP domain-containing histidine kinase [Candidatus Nitrosocosmicus franklandus]|uniref:Uncharacterized protein n=1 Tax=Candidatus Nitrosocosmicus franklandianus TaxID=1798806 RepID=A0A484IHG2_9ARCH|nr:HAMP domain-containing histidine kinase [Candidatus Nitrosocosmicus franklandus]VFJ14346.1 protein of unknown function [Candidatus Nitrosocosmicus franklandus]
MNEKIQNVLKDINSGNILNPLLSNLKNVRINFESTKDPIMVFADKIRIVEVLTNLITNAIKFSDGKPITITVKKVQKNAIDYKHTPVDNRVVKPTTTNDVKENQDDVTNMMKWVIVSIRDRWMGIDADILLTIYQIYFQIKPRHWLRVVYFRASSRHMADKFGFKIMKMKRVQPSHLVCHFLNDNRPSIYEMS